MLFVKLKSIDTWFEEKQHFIPTIENKKIIRNINSNTKKFPGMAN